MTDNGLVRETPQGWSLEGASPARLRELLDTFTHKLADRGIDCDHLLNPGASAEEVKAGFASVDLVAPDELVVWFGWHNGLRENGNHQWFGHVPFVFPMTLKWCIDDYKYQLAEGIPLGVWTAGWFALEAEVGLAVFCGADPADSLLVRKPDPESGDSLDVPSVNQLVSLCTLVTWWIDALDAGYATPGVDAWDWKYDNPGLIDIDHETLILP